MNSKEIAEMLGFDVSDDLLDMAKWVLYISSWKRKRLFAKPWWEDVWGVLGPEVIRGGSGWNNYCSAHRIPGSDIKAHLQVVLEKGDGTDNYLSAANIQCADKEKHLARARKLECSWLVEVK